ncbi:polysaccharide biosynthesis/export family protein [Iodidimonas sp. SYSU 1G8]|uniref:polysaccharide biosynthesis/export family protein n=1 Tax=Iodidimonas sp. SYSU 1G8 TaxID=3133967 RepID=UPI0031FEEF4F
MWTIEDMAGRRMAVWLKTWLAVMLVMLAGFAASASAQTDQRYNLGPGDQVRVTVFGETDLSGEFKVGDDGNISLPLIGPIKAQGLTTAQLEQTMIERLTPDYVKNPNVSIQVMNYRPFFIIGEVNSPGSYPYVSGMTVLEAVALAGGFTYRAKTEQVYIKRSVDGTSEETLLPIETAVMPGDVIRVRERYF